MAQRNLSGEIMASSREPKDLSPKDRVCTFPDCGAVLSIYNPKDRCSLHPDHRVMHAGVKHRKLPRRRS